MSRDSASSSSRGSQPTPLLDRVAAPGSGSGRGTCPARASTPGARTRAGAHAAAPSGSMRTAQNLNSGILPEGSISSMVSRLAAASRKWNGMKQLPRASRCGHLDVQLDLPAARGHPGQLAVDQAELARRRRGGRRPRPAARWRPARRTGGSSSRCASAPAAGRC